MRLLIGSFLLLSTAAALAATVETPAGKIDLPPQPSRQYVHPTPSPPADPDVSWGKAGVSYAAYRQDTLYCGSYGVIYALDAPAWAVSRDGDVWNIIKMNYAASDFRRLGQFEVEHCLGLRGYSKFRLTREQTAHLETLQPGSQERRQYLYALSSDAAVLDSQKL